MKGRLWREVWEVRESFIYLFFFIPSLPIKGGMKMISRNPVADTSVNLCVNEHFPKRCDCTHFLISETNVTWSCHRHSSVGYTCTGLPYSLSYEVFLWRTYQRDVTLSFRSLVSLDITVKREKETHSYIWMDIWECKPGMRWDVEFRLLDIQH